MHDAAQDYFALIYLLSRLRRARLCTRYIHKLLKAGFLYMYLAYLINLRGKKREIREKKREKRKRKRRKEREGKELEGGGEKRKGGEEEKKGGVFIA